jgi:hypothetical protein
MNADRLLDEQTQNPKISNEANACFFSFGISWFAHLVRRRKSRERVTTSLQCQGYFTIAIQDMGWIENWDGRETGRRDTMTLYGVRITGAQVARGPR